MNGLEEPSIAKRLRGTPERIELENYRLSVRQAEGLQEVPEETQAEHNLSSMLDKGTEEDAASRSAAPAGLGPSCVCPWLSPQPLPTRAGSTVPASNMGSEPDYLGWNIGLATLLAV